MIRSKPVTGDRPTTAASSYKYLYGIRQATNRLASTAERHKGGGGLQ